jgi:serine/threonine protein kinase
MTRIDNAALERLRQIADAPELEGTRYNLLGKLGQGGMGGVFRVEDSQLERQVAMKVVSVPDPDGELSRRLLQEARIIARLEHPGIVPIHDSGTLSDGRPYYTMKLVEGQPLDEHRANLPALSDRLRLFLRVAEALAFAHARGILHRDLKPSNIMVGPFGEVLVLDWGLSRIMHETEDKKAGLSADQAAPTPNPHSRGTSHGAVLGTPGYMAPEQSAGHAVDARADVYSLGALLHFLLAHTSGSRAPRALVAIQHKAMAENPAERYQTVGMLAADIEHFLDGLPVLAFPESRFRRGWHWILRNRAWLLLLLVYVVVRILLIYFRSP